MENIDQVLQLIEKKFDETNKKIESIQTTLQTDIATIHTDLGQHNDRITSIERDLRSIKESSQIDELKIQIETLKQDRLRNNVRLTGLPPIAFDDPIDTVFGIDSILQLGLIPSDFTAYADRNKSSLIISFGSHSLKRTFMNSLQQRKSLLAEEVFPTLQSNSNIYANDQLTPYFAKLFQAAWQAKKDGQIFSASSLGGRIKVKKCENSPAIIVDTEQQLNEVINVTPQNAAPTQSNGLSDSRNDNNGNSSNNSNNSNSINDNREGISQTKSQQPASNNPALQRYIAHRPQIHRPDQRPIQRPNHRPNRPTTNKFSTKIRADLHQHRIQSRDRAYRGNIDFETSPPHYSNDNRFESYGRQATPPHRSYGKSRSNEQYDSRSRYTRAR